MYKFTLVRKNGLQRTIHLYSLPSLTNCMQLTVDGESVKILPLSSLDSRILFEAQSELSVSDVGALLALVAACGGLIWALVWSYNAEIGTKPDADVMAAVRAAGLTNAQVSNSEATTFMLGGSGCDKNDSRRYIVRQNGSQVAIVCQGSAIKLFGWQTKAPALRFRSGE